jgi:hypothetical protein
MNPNGLSTGVVRVKDTMTAFNKAQRATDATSFEETLPSLQARHTRRVKRLILRIASRKPTNQVIATTNYKEQTDGAYG